MLLDKTKRQNPRLITTALELHRSGLIPPNTFVFDADTFVSNANAIRKRAEEYQMKLYFMSKQHGRNPELFRRITRPGKKETVSVNMECSRILHKHGIGLGHMGNLVQVSSYELDKIIGTYEPEVITVFSVEKAAQINVAAAKYGKVQNILLRVHTKEDTFFPGMEGGFYIEDLKAAAKKISLFENVSIAGVTSFPVLAYNQNGAVPIPTNNLTALVKAREILEDMGISCWQVNAPGNNSYCTIEFLSKYGVTHIEPGSALTGSCTYHLFDDSLPEKPAMVYVTEVSHKWDDKIYVMGGGFFVDDPPMPLSKGFQHMALTGTNSDEILNHGLKWLGTGASLGGGFARIDYHGILDANGCECKVGDTVIFGFRSQLFMTRSYSAVVENISNGAPRLAGIWDWAGNRVGGGLE
jgi:predicted amino acid racemase